MSFHEFRLLGCLFLFCFLYFSGFFSSHYRIIIFNIPVLFLFFIFDTLVLLLLLLLPMRMMMFVYNFTHPSLVNTNLPVAIVSRSLVNLLQHSQTHQTYEVRVLDSCGEKISSKSKHPRSRSSASTAQCGPVQK